MNIKVPVSWLREYLKTDLAAKTLASQLSLSGPSVEKIEKAGTDLVFDVEVTANRFDAASVYGLARETHAILQTNDIKSKLDAPKGLNTSLEPDRPSPLTLDVLIKDKSLCPRFTAIVVDNVKIGPSPAYIKSRLQACGIRAINNIVDITNYLMLELGQPMHTFDYDKIKGAKMILRSAKEGEKITTLDGQVRTLPKDTIVIQDSQRLIDLCGIMGGENSRVTSRTKRVVIFVQAYDPVRIRKTTQAMGFRTDAATRFEKGIDLDGILPALKRAVHLAKETSGAKIASELVDIYQKKQASTKLKLTFEKLNEYLGISMPGAKAAQILTSLGFNVETTNLHLVAQAPSWRAIDIEDDVDLIEEIARLWGYYKLPSRLPHGEVPYSERKKSGIHASDEANFERRSENPGLQVGGIYSQTSDLEQIIELKKALRFLGLTEVISYSIVSKELLALAKPASSKIVELANPLSENWQYMRTSVVPSLLEVLSQNLSLNQNLKLFEIAKTYLAQKNDLPKQDLFLTVVLSNSSFLQIKGLSENIVQILSKNAKWLSLSKNSSVFEKGVSAEIKIGDETVGFAGFIDSKLASYFALANITALELNLTKIFSLPSVAKNFKPIPKYPPVIEDISAIFATIAPVAEIVETVEKASALVKKTEVIDIFEDARLGENKRSVTVRITYQKPSETPRQEEVEQERSKIIHALERQFRAKIRK